MLVAREITKSRPKQRPPYGYGRLVTSERRKAKQMTYTGSCDYSHLMLMAAIIREEEKNSRVAMMLEGAASAVKRAYIAAWLSCGVARQPINRPKR